MTVDWKRIFFLFVALGTGVLAGATGQPLIHNNEQAVNVIVTVFSILAGFLVAIMTIMGEPGSLLGRGWRSCEINRKNIFSRLVRQKWMFYLYLATLGLVFTASLTKNVLPLLTVWIERIYLGGATTAFILSLGLPSALLNIQLERHDEIIDAKRKAVGIKD